MNLFNARGFARQSYGVMAILFIALLSLGDSVALAQQTEPPSAAPAAEAPKIPNDQLDSLVAPIALYPDPLLAQTLAASTYPLEIIQLEQLMKKNPNLKGKVLSDAVEKQNWDPSVQSMAEFPDVVKQLAENVSWSSDLGNAFLAQQADVMDAVQRMRAKAQGAGNLKTSKQQKVETKTVESKTVIVIEQADPEVVYVPAYNPTVVYGASAYPYPSIYYPPGYGMLAFGAGIAIGAAWGHGGWGYGCGWGHGDVTINNGNKYVNHYNNNNNINNRPGGGNNGNRPGGGNNWQHRPEHRGGAPYGDRNTANKYGGRARQQPAGGAGNRPGGGAGAGNIGAGNRPGGGAGIGAGGSRPSTMPAGGGANRIGSQNLGGGSRGGGGSPSFSSRGGGGGFGGGSGSYNRASSSRGGHSMGGGGFSRGGGGGGARGGGGRGGGGRRR